MYELRDVTSVLKVNDRFYLINNEYLIRTIDKDYKCDDPMIQRLDERFLLFGRYESPRLYRVPGVYPEYFSTKNTVKIISTDMKCIRTVLFDNGLKDEYFEYELQKVLETTYG